jgi:chromosome segregation ATPase
MKFEDLTGIYPSDQFDRQNSKESALLSEEKNTKDLTEEIRSIQEKIAELKKEINIASEEDSGVPQGFLQGKSMELSEAQAELKILSQKLTPNNPLSKENLEAQFKQQSSQN